MAIDRRKTRCVECVPKCASARVASSNIVYLSTDIDPRRIGLLSTDSNLAYALFGWWKIYRKLKDTNLGMQE